MANPDKCVEVRQVKRASSQSPADSSLSSWKMLTRTLTAFLVPVVLAIVLVRSSKSWHGLIDSRDIGPPSTNPACANPPMDQCSFYADCLESRYHCGPDGYPIGYGQKYCTKFSDERALLDAQGQQWMVDTMHCLQLVLVPDAIGANATTCDALKDQAFASHAGCYTSNGFCTLGVHNWAAVLEIVDITTLFSSWDAFKQMIETAADCGEFYAYMVEQGLF